MCAFCPLSRLQWLIPTCQRYVTYSIHARNYCFVILCRDVFHYYYVYYLYGKSNCSFNLTTTDDNSILSYFNPVNHLPSLRSWAPDFLVRECLLTRNMARARSAFCSQYKAARDTFHPLLCGDSTRPPQTDHNKTQPPQKWNPLLSPSSRREKTARPPGMMRRPATMRRTPTSRSWGNLWWSAGRPPTCTPCPLSRLQKVKVQTLAGIFGRSSHMNRASDNRVSPKIDICILRYNKLQTIIITGDCALQL